MKRLFLIFILLCAISFAKGKTWTGTGFALKGKYVITNHHVVDGAYSLQVRGVKGDFTKMYNAVVVATDIKNDMAIIRIEDDRFTGFGDIPYAIKSDCADVAERIFAAGYPLLAYMGEELKYSPGSIQSQSGYKGDIYSYQFSAPVQPGNSGGPLFNSSGDVVGIVHSGIPEADNVAYATKSPYMRLFIQNCIGSSAIPTNRKMAGWDPTKQFKAISPFVFIIYASTEGGGWLKVSDVGSLKNADVHIDGTYIGTTPITSSRLASGEYIVRITKPLYKPFAQKVTIRNGEITNCNPVLVADFATVSLTVANDCSIFINNKYYGQGSWRGILTPGTYKFEARKDGYTFTSINRTIVASSSEQCYTIPTPQPILGKINVTSSPTGADVFVDDKIVDQTPLKQDIIVGYHEIIIKKNGYLSQSWRVNISKGQTEDIEAKLTAITPVSLSVNNDNDCDIYINDENVGKSSWSGELVAGTYRFEARKSGHTTTSITKTIEAPLSEQHFVLPTPEPIFGKLKVVSTPTGARVYIDSEFTGYTPLTQNLIIGDHTISIYKDKYQSERREVYIGEKQTEDVDAKLQKVMKGFASIIELTSNVGFGGAYSSIGVNYIAGYRFNHYLYLGGGTGLNFNFGAKPSRRSVSETYENKLLNPCLVSIPLFGYFRANILKSHCSPFIALAAGGNFSGKQTLHLDICDVRYNNTGIFINPQIGVILHTNTRTDYLFAIGLQCFSSPSCIKYTGYNASFKQSFGYGIDFHIGFTF